MSKPIAYEPQQGYKFQILCRCPLYDRSWEHCDYAKDSPDKLYLLKNYRQAYGIHYQFKVIRLPQKFWK